MAKESKLGEREREREREGGGCCPALATLLQGVELCLACRECGDKFTQRKQPKAICKIQKYLVANALQSNDQSTS